MGLYLFKYNIFSDVLYYLLCHLKKIINDMYVLQSKEKMY